MTDPDKVTLAECIEWCEGEMRFAETDGRPWGATFARSILSHLRTLAGVEAERDRYRKLDAEAATYVETEICMRTHFTGEPPYVGWKGLGLALREVLDERDRLRAALASVEAGTHVVVPVEPTEAMLRAGWHRAGVSPPRDTYRVMLSARPGAPE